MSSVAQTGVQPDYDQAIAFLARWYGQAARVLTSIAPDRSGAITTTTFSAGDDDAIRAWLEQHGASRNVYFTVNPLRGPVQKKAAKTDVAALAWLHIDIDPRAGEEISAEQERALRVLRTPPGNVPPPTVVVFSGGGYQGFWRLAEPIPIDGDVAAADDAARFNIQLEILFGADHCHNVDRIMRLPGTINRPDEKKRKKGRVEALAQLVEWHDDRVYDIREFRRAPPNPQAATPTNGEIVSRVPDLPASLSALAKRIIQHGHDPDDPNRWPSRSEVLFLACCELVRSGVSDDSILAIITNPSFGVSASVLDKGSRAQSYAQRQVARARLEVGECRPRVQLPQGAHQHRDFAIEIAPYMAASGWFARGDAVVFLKDESLAVVTPAAAVTAMERHAEFYRIGKDGPSPALLDETIAKFVVKSREFLDLLPPIIAVYDCPMLVNRRDAMVTVTGYDEETGILAHGTPPIEASLDEAKRILLDLLRDFAPLTDSDRARMIAALITPALNAGKLLGRDARVPMIVLEADESQAGKGLFVRLLTGIYSSHPTSIAQTHKGVGSLEEAIAKYLHLARPFIQLDNIRGRLDLPFLEAALTELRIECRYAYSPGGWVDPSTTCFFLTSNNAELTPDQANRCCIIRIRKQPKGYQYHEWPEGGPLEHVRQNASRYLGAIHSILREWNRLGRPVAPDDGGHDFRPWARAVRWIVRDLLKIGDPIEGHRSVQRRTSQPAYAWLRTVVLAVAQSGRLGEDLSASDLLDVLASAGVGISGPVDAQDSCDQGGRRAQLQGLGRQLRAAFRGEDEVEVDRYRVTRTEAPDSRGHHNRRYRIEVMDGGVQIVH